MNNRELADQLARLIAGDEEIERAWRADPASAELLAALHAWRAQIGVTVIVYRDAILTALRAAPEGWRPIETAPKDGPAVLLYGPYNEIGVATYDRGRWWYSADGAKAIEYMGDFGTDYKEFDLATHWQPLPEPPP